jgi:hypothetical protein
MYLLENQGVERKKIKNSARHFMIYFALSTFQGVRKIKVS